MTVKRGEEKAVIRVLANHWCLIPCFHLMGLFCASFFLWHEMSRLSCSLWQSVRAGSLKALPLKTTITESRQQQTLSNLSVNVCFSETASWDRHTPSCATWMLRRWGFVHLQSSWMALLHNHRCAWCVAQGCPRSVGWRNSAPVCFKRESQISEAACQC